MGCISAIDHQTRTDVQELLSRYCHYLDQNRGDCWAQLFTHDGIYENSDGIVLRGRAELQSFPSIAGRDGDGMLRHIVSSIIVDRMDTSRDLLVTAYGLVADLRGDGGFTKFYDYKVRINRTPAWRIARLVATRVGGIGPALPGSRIAELTLHS